MKYDEYIRELKKEGGRPDFNLMLSRIELRASGPSLPEIPRIRLVLATAFAAVFISVAAIVSINMMPGEKLSVSSYVLTQDETGGSVMSYVLGE